MIGKIRQLFRVASKKAQFSVTPTTASPKAFLRDILTDFVVSESTADATESLVHLLNSIFADLFAWYERKTRIRLYFVYRGGNVIRAYRKAFEDHISGAAREYFSQAFDSYFRESDLDFYVIIHDGHTMTAEKVRAVAEDVQAMSYEALARARDAILQRPTKYLSFLKYNKEVLTELFAGVVAQAQEQNPHPDVRVVAIGFEKTVYPPLVAPKEPYIRKDFLVFPTAKGLGITDLPDRGKPSPLYISVNGEIADHEQSVAFKLTRLLINFVAFFETRDGLQKTNVSSELYDVSVGLKEDKMFEKYSQDSFREYHCRDGHVLIPTLETLIEDLEVILFSRGTPWEDPKYKKRIKRLIVLLMIQDMSVAGLRKTRKVLSMLLGSRPLKSRKGLGRLQSMLGAVDQKAKAFYGFRATVDESLKEIDKVLLKVEDFIRNDAKLYLSF